MAQLSVYSQVASNKRRTWFIMVFFVLFITALSYLIGKTTNSTLSFTGIALIFSGLTSLGSYYWSDKIVLAMTGARPADREKDFDLFTTTENMAIAAGLPKPKVYVIEDSSLNAFATGRDPNHGVVCVTRGLIEKLDRRELEGVISHELSHIKNYDIRLMAVVTVLVGTIAFISDWFIRMAWWGGRGRSRRDRSSSSSILQIAVLILAVLSPLIATVIQLAISRRREFLADASSVLLTRNPSGLASALSKISNDPNILRTASNATAHLFISNPFKGSGIGAKFTNLFNTHPPIKERVRILQNM